MVRRLGIAIAMACLACAALLSATTAAAATGRVSASSWRATLIGTVVRGGATTLLQDDGHGSVNVTVRGVAANSAAAAYLVEARCGSTGRTLASYPLEVDATGTATGKLSLTPAQVAA